MRMMGLTIGLVLVAGCASDWTTPEYQAYRATREAALTGKAATPRTIPVALPTQALTPAQIAAEPQSLVVLPAARPVKLQTASTRTTGPWPRQPVSAAAHEAACGRYYTPAKAQENFLRAGGPQVDPVGLDPDGDGYACTWRPDAGL